MVKITIVGTGYVGLASGTCLAEVGHEVICADISQEKINMLNNGKIPIYEPGLEEIIGKKAKINQMPMQPGDVEKTYTDISKTEKLLGYNPKTNLKEGLKKFWEWYKEFYLNDE